MIFVFADGEFRFFTAELGSAQGDAVIVFRVRIDREPKERAKEKKIYGKIRTAFQYEIYRWFQTHPEPVLQYLHPELHEQHTTINC